MRPWSCSTRVGTLARARATWHRRLTRRRRRASSSSTTSSRSSASSPSATSRPSSPSRRSPTSASCCRWRASGRACASAATRPGLCWCIDETNTFSAGPGGATARSGLEPDALTIGKSLGGGVPCGAYGLTDALAERVVALARDDGEYEDVGGLGGTLAGNALSLAAMRAVLGEVLTDEAFVAMEQLSSSFVDGVQHTIDANQRPGPSVELGARCEYRFAWPAPINGAISARSLGPLARGVLPPLRDESRRAADPVSQHGAHLSGDHGLGRGAPRTGLRRGRRGSPLR